MPRVGHKVYRASLITCATATVTLAPLGLDLGLFAVGAACLYAVFAFRDVARYAVLWAPFTAPTAMALPLATMVSTNFSYSGLEASLGQSLLFLLGLPTALSIASHTPRKLLVAGLLLGGTVLSISIGYAAAFHLGQIPVGLYERSSLHNWAAVPLVLIFVVAFAEGTRVPRSLPRAVAVACAIIAIAGIIITLSWVGFLAVLASAITLAIIGPSGMARMLARRVTVTLAMTGLVTLVSIGRHMPQLAVTLSRAALGRFRVYYEALAAASNKPIFGWGWTGNQLSSVLHSMRPPIGAYYLDDLSLGHAHNIVLQALVTTGLVGTVATVFYFSRLGVALYQSRPLGRYGLAAFVGFLVTQNLDYSWDFTPHALLALLVFSLYLRGTALEHSSVALSAKLKRNG